MSEQCLSTDQANGAVMELLLDISSQFNAFRIQNDARLIKLESRQVRPVEIVAPVNVPDTSATSSLQTVYVQPLVEIAPSTAPSTNIVASSASIRMLERDMPTLSDENFPDWLDHAVAYAHAAGWGDDDIPQVFKDKTHESSKIAREFLYNKLSVGYKLNPLRDEVMYDIYVFGHRSYLV